MRAVALLTLLALCGCEAEDGRPPVARIDVAPEAIPEHDNFATPVTLDGTASDDPIDDPDGLAPLAFAWEISGDEARFEPGSHADDAVIVVRLRGDTPATFALTVTDEDGRSTTAVRQMTLSVASAASE